MLLMNTRRNNAIPWSVVFAVRPNVNLLLTSRPHVNIEDIITRDLEMLEVRANEDDVRRYIEARIVKSSRLSKHVGA